MCNFTHSCPWNNCWCEDSPWGKNHFSRDSFFSRYSTQSNSTNLFFPTELLFIINSMCDHHWRKESGKWHGFLMMNMMERPREILSSLYCALHIIANPHQRPWRSSPFGRKWLMHSTPIIWGEFEEAECLPLSVSWTHHVLLFSPETPTTLNWSRHISWGEHMKEFGNKSLSPKDPKLNTGNWF